MFAVNDVESPGAVSPVSKMAAFLTPTRLICAAALVLFALPLYVGLGRNDLENDESGYSYSVDRILTLHEWLTPRGIYGDDPFLEKPPLKTWIVAAGIRLGLPHNEFGLRFFDPLFSIIAFAYVFAIGRRLAGPVCGFVALLILFTFTPLVFEHGLRTNNMEAGLVLTYCGGMYHFFRWGETLDRRRRRLHALAFAGYFAFGFMVKFVAALFLPVAALVAFLWQPGVWAKLKAGWSDWIWPTLLAVALIAPWFVYETVLFGADFWHQIFGVHIVQRFTSFLDPSHVHPWHFYFTTTWEALRYSGGLALAVIGLVWLAVRAWQGRPWLARLILVWWLVPYVLLSVGTSKLFHYAYPFLPPLALGAGLAAARWLDLANGWIEGLSLAGRPLLVRRIWLRRLFVGAAIGAIAIGLWNIGGGQVTWVVGGVRLFRSTSPVRILLVAVLLLALANAARIALRIACVAVLLIVAPATNYARQWPRLTEENRPLHVIRDCMLYQVRAGAVARPGVYIADAAILSHPFKYYLESTGRWVDSEGRAGDDELIVRLFVPGQQTAVILSILDVPALEARLEAAALAETAAHRPAPSLPLPIIMGYDAGPIAVLLPGPYEPCVAAMGKAGGQTFVMY